MHFDVNALLGHWPFRKIRKNTLDHLRAVHRDNGITGGYVASLNSIFYNDPFEGDEELHETIAGTEYKHVLTVNPTLPGWRRDIEEGLARFDIRGVRIYPTYHDYDLASEPVAELCGVLKRHGLPLFVTKRMEDERLDYMMKPKPLDVGRLRAFANAHPDLDIVVLNIRFNEIAAMKNEANRLPRLFFDTCGLKDKVFALEELLRIVPASKFLYGSQHPLYCLKSSYGIVAMTGLPERTIRDILAENVKVLSKVE
ncbi:amidohydrolase family protein [Paenibacillus sp. GYB003]|uniref:amidohydrolase family protein n=1 Tax=Paenibacillus sp. GYB003 TaxID=2994392 RepID=UPI002F965FEE